MKSEEKERKLRVEALKAVMSPPFKVVEINDLEPGNLKIKVVRKIEKK